MNDRFKRGLVLCGVFGLGMVIASGASIVAIKRFQSPTVPSQWFALLSSKDLRELVLTDQNQVAPKIKQMNGTVKFVSIAGSQGWPINTLGYLIHATLGHSDLPDWRNAGYEVTFQFSLLDKDGFEIMEVDSPSLTLKSDASVELQGHTETSIDSRIAEQTKNITYRMHVTSNY